VRRLARRPNRGNQHEEPPLQHRPVSRGAWYNDPFGASDERWWDGKKWTDVVREPPGKRLSGSGHATGGPELVDQTHGPQDWFPVSIKAVVGKKLRVVPRDPKPYGHFDVLTADTRIGSLTIGGTEEVARMASAEGAWCLKKRNRLGWELVIESPDGRHVGWYSGRRWLPGGTISLTDGTQVELRRSISGRWRLQTVQTKDAFVRFRRSLAPASLTTIFRIRSLPAGITDVPLLVLTACAVLTLQRTLPPVINLAPS
jgi:Protein of unknown function (DUF2510)